MEQISFTSLAADIEMIGYYNGLVIAKNEWGDVFVSERPEEFYFPGELIESKSVTPLSDLFKVMQAIILRYLHVEEEENGTLPPSSYAKQAEENVKNLEQLVREITEEYEVDPEAFLQMAQFSPRFYPYSIRNQILIQNQNPRAVLVGSFEKWKELGYSVKEKEQGIKILVPTPVTLFRESEDTPWKSLSQATYQEKLNVKNNGYETRKITRFKIGTVFDLSQTTCPSSEYPKFFDTQFSSQLHPNIREELLLHPNVQTEIPTAQLELESDILRIMLQTNLGTEVTDLIKSDFAKHCHTYQQYVEENKDTENIPSLLQCFQKANDIYRDNVEKTEPEMQNTLNEKQ